MSAVLKPESARCRPMVEADLRRVVEVEGAAYEFPWSQGIFQDCLRVGYCCWVMELDRRIIGHGVMTVGAGECHILNLCIHPDWQQMGFGSALLDQLLDVARTHRADTAFLEVRPSNGIAKHLYFNAGFDEVGMRRDYYPAQRGREDAIIMARNLI